MLSVPADDEKQTLERVTLDKTAAGTMARLAMACPIFSPALQEVTNIRGKLLQQAMQFEVFARAFPRVCHAGLNNGNTMKNPIEDVGLS